MKSSQLFPAGYTVVKDGHTLIVIKEDYKDRLMQQGISSPDVLVTSDRTTPVAYSGRGATPSLAIAGSSEKMIIRKYQRGGLLRFFIRDMYWGRKRPFKELIVGTNAFVQGVPTAETLAAVSVKIVGPFYRGYLITRELSTCRDIAYFFSTSIRQIPSEKVLREKRLLLRQIAQAIRSMHDKGFYHGDLNMKNVLIDITNPHNVYVIDWDKSQAHREISTAARSNNILRFCRSMEKFRRRGLPISRSDQLFFLKSYWGEEKNVQKRLRKDFMRMKLSSGMRKFRWRLEGM